MYSNCIHCSRPLGRNEALETFPVGELIAFDAWKGRLWAVCPVCRRWNLAPIEERWEAVEHADQRFRSTRLRVQAENVGIARLPDGTQLIRIGNALPGELAAWRYGEELRARRRTFRARSIFETAVLVLAPEAVGIRVLARKREVVYRVRGGTLPGGSDMVIREKDLERARIRTGAAGDLHVSLAGPRSGIGRLRGWVGGRADPRITLSADSAHGLMSRALVRVNAPGASKRDLRLALGVFERHGSPVDILSAAGGELTIAARRWSFMKRLQVGTPNASGRRSVPRAVVLALEMSLHEDAERRALAGELEQLKERWREAEEIARIADGLLD